MKNYHQFKKKNQFSRAPAHLSQEGHVVISLGSCQHVHVCITKPLVLTAYNWSWRGNNAPLLFPLQSFHASSWTGTTCTEVL